MGQEKIGYIYLGWPIDESSLDAILVQILDGACKLDVKGGVAKIALGWKTSLLKILSGSGLM